MVIMMDVKSKSLGLDASPPEGKCSSELCPWHGHLKVRGSVFSGTVESVKSQETSIVRWDFYRYIPKYERYERHKTSVAAHKPKCIELNVGDKVKIAECRPVSKTKKFVVIEKVVK